MFEFATEQISLIGKTSLQPGDHIAVPYDGYWHHGIYDGDYFVIDLCPQAEKNEGIFNQLFQTVNGVVRRVHLSDFVRKKSTFVIRIVYSNVTTTGEEAQRQARKFLSQIDMPYNLTFCNCECMATYCWTGRYLPLNFKVELLDYSRHKFNPLPVLWPE